MYDYFFGNDNLYFIQLKLLQRHTNEFKIIILYKNWSKNKIVMEIMVKDRFYLFEEINLSCFTYTQIFYSN